MLGLGWSFDVFFFSSGEVMGRSEASEDERGGGKMVVSVGWELLHGVSEGIFFFTGG